jgi:putative DNA primase/helicase
VALVKVGYFAAHEILGLPVPYRNPLEYAWEAAGASALDADRPAAAMAAVWSWASAHQTEFWGRGVRERDWAYRVPVRGWVGKWAQGKWTEIAWYPEALERVLRFQGFENPEEVLSAWQERGWIEMDGRHRTKHRRVDGERVRLVVLPREHMDAEEGPTDEDVPTL